MHKRRAGRLPAVHSLLLALFTALGATLAQALPGDREQPIHITADKAIRDEKRGVTTYSGNVQMRQGSMELESDTLVIFHDDEQAERIVARGKPARMRQQPKPDKGVVYARAQEITYYRREERVHLQTEAHIEQDGSQVTGDSIDYDIAKELVKAVADPKTAGDKVVVVIPPSAFEEDPNSPPASGSAPVPGSTPAPERVENPTDSEGDAGQRGAAEGN